MADASFAAGAAAAGGAPVPVDAPAKLQYVCGNCNALNNIKPREPVRCRACGYRILYKMRTTRLTQYEAR
ncbi:hypothetical protein FNF27_01962 [Cafeteria roenbergensis]|uniref:Uncharacterized protein n=1 Tax=Cafeteria roenbergensis TaxID=33653 RepID=A0A5A8ELM3_CAFRO|nr:hypothetical protein FNF29_00410 [Cafeteria roenbergensis]KAA0168896.1 hypothetical protein FNF31_00057 [Cafeteria roenbergensis]KAA0170578.1 hypothetical protein FNF28_01340 [Cafeteria roenbergensis]KAA0176681.1 hypothetical protein FNF27_01962 [Cafeteria roenbergensis]|eukprot:KAA0157058.1 hypothetical protein FNF29_00410 [Cafeteria roenbergensis]